MREESKFSGETIKTKNNLPSRSTGLFPCIFRPAPRFFSSFCLGGNLYLLALIFVFTIVIIIIPPQIILGYVPVFIVILLLIFIFLLHFIFIRNCWDCSPAIPCPSFLLLPPPEVVVLIVALHPLFILHRPPLIEASTESGPLLNLEKDIMM